MKKRKIGILTFSGGRKDVYDSLLAMSYEFATFADAVSFLDEIAAIASVEEHTPDVCIEGYNKMRLSLYTYCCGGLTENDFILAAKIGKVHEDFEK